MTPPQFLKRYPVGSFYHFTDLRNLDSIRRNGLLRYAELRRRGINPSAPGGNDWSHDADINRGLDEYVHLCLMSQHPMEFCARQEGRIANSRFLAIVPAILNFDGVRFTADVSNKNGIPLLTLSEAVEQLDFEVVYDHTDWRDSSIQERRRVARKYELLIPADIETQYILSL